MVVKLGLTHFCVGRLDGMNEDGVEAVVPTLRKTRDAGAASAVIVQRWASPQLKEL